MNHCANLYTAFFRSNTIFLACANKLGSFKGNELILSIDCVLPLIALQSEFQPIDFSIRWYS
jgi:hypothetical protein